jgi:hypothetical protein
MHSFYCLSYDGSIASCKRVLHTVRSGASSFSLECLFFSLRSSSSFLHLLPYLPILTSIFLPVTCFRRQFLSKIWWIQLFFLLFVICRMFLPPLDSVIFRLSHDQSNWSSPSFSITTFQNLWGVSDLLSEISMFQHCTKLCSRCSTVLNFSLILIPICWWKESFCCWKLLLPR